MSTSTHKNCTLFTFFTFTFLLCWADSESDVSSSLVQPVEASQLEDAWPFSWWSEPYWPPECLDIILVVGAIFVLLALQQHHNCKRKWSASRHVDKLGYERKRGDNEHRQPVSEIGHVKKTLPRPEAKPKAVPDVGCERLRFSEQLCAFARKGEVENAAKLLRHMEQRFGKLSTPDYSSIITMYAKRSDPIGAQKWLRRMQEVGLVPTQICFNAVINAHAKLGDLDEATAVANEMRNCSIEFDTVTFNTFIDAAARGGDAVRAQAWMRKMLDCNVNPSVVSFGSVMRACAEAGLDEDLDYWAERANQLGIQLNSICYNAVIRAFVQRGHLIMALAWLNRMLDSDVQASMPCFLAVADAIIERGDIQRAAAIVEQMRESKLPVETSSCSPAIITACRAGCFDVAKAWATAASAKNMTLSKAAERALTSASITVADVSSTGLQAGLDDKFDCSRSKLSRSSCIGKEFVGTIKEFISCKFGHIQCDETFKVFKRDVFLCAADNPDLLGKGQRVSFTLQIEKRSGLPRASDLTVYHTTS